jgi:hypothetical protein
VPFSRPIDDEGAVSGAFACLVSSLAELGYGSSGAQEPCVGSQLGSTIPRFDSA